MGKYKIHGNQTTNQLQLAKMGKIWEKWIDGERWGKDLVEMDGTVSDAKDLGERFEMLNRRPRFKSFVVVNLFS